MGCDIHLHTEIKINGTWHHYSHPDIGRCYSLFEKMAGVRGDPENAIDGPRGLPHDITLITQIDAERWEGDGHSHSYFDAEEIQILFKWIEHAPEDDRWESRYQFGYPFGKGWNLEDLKDLDVGIENIRFVFWFDN